MKKNIVALVMLCSSVATLAMSAPARAGMGSNSVGPSLLITNGTTSIGVDSKFGISDNISVRPAAYFPSGGTAFGASLTYDFDVSRSRKLQMGVALLRHSLLVVLILVSPIASISKLHC
jgi:hypothetical protein